MFKPLKLHKVLKLSYDNNEKHQQKMKNNGYALASQIRGEDEIEKIYNANYNIENSEENIELLKQQNI